MSTAVASASNPMWVLPVQSTPLIAGGYVYVTYSDPSANGFISRYVESTMELDGTVEMGSLGSADSHVYLNITVDPTDNCIVVLKPGRIAVAPWGMTRTWLWKSAHAWGGNTSEWAANDFGSYATVPQPLDDSNSLPGYGTPTFLPDGTFVFFCSDRQKTYDTIVYPDLLMWRVVGDGTPKTATQLATGGSWTRVMNHSTDWETEYPGHITMPAVTGRCYPGFYPQVYGTTGIALPFTSYRGYDGAFYDRWGVGFIKCDDITAADPVWKKADGTTFATGTALDYTLRHDPVAMVWAGPSDYYPSCVMVDGTPHMLYARTTSTLNPADDRMLTAALYHATWNGSAWAHTKIRDFDANIAWPITDLQYDNGVLVGIISDGTIVYSGDLGVTWNQRTTAISKTTMPLLPGTAIPAQKTVRLRTADASQFAYLYIESNGTTDTAYVEKLTLLAATPDADSIDLAWSGTAPFKVERRVV